MRKTVLPLSLLAAACLTSVQAESFESPSYQAGEPLSETSLWQGVTSNGLTITKEEAAEGSQSLQIVQESTVTTATHPGGVKFYQFYLLANFEETATQPTVNVAGAEFSLVKTSATTGGVAIYPTPTAGSVLPRSTLPLITGDPNSETWVLVTVRVDWVKNKWDLYLDGQPVAANLALAEQTEQFTVTAAVGSAYLDAYREGSENPLFVDTDKDGVPDAEEKALGLNAYGDDREGDLDGDGISNANEFFSGQPPQISQNAPSTGRPILYVDNLHGSDANSGQHSYAMSGTGGPKASIGAAMQAAVSGSIITVLEGTGSYKESALGIEGKDLTIKTVEPINIK